MADNVGITPGSGDKAASRSVTYSGEAAQVQIVGLSVVSGPDDAKTVEDVSAVAPLPVRMDQGPGALVTENGALRVDPTQVNEQAQEVLNATGLHSLGDEPLQLVGLHPSFPLPIDTATPMPIAGRDSTGAQRQALTDGDGALRTLGKDAGPFLYGPDQGISGNRNGAIFSVEGYSAIVVWAITAGSNLGVQQSVDGIRFGSASAGVTTLAGGFSLAANGGMSTTEYTVFPVVGKFARINFGGAITGQPLVLVYLKAGPLGFNLSLTTTNLAQIGGFAVTANTPQLAVNAFGPTLPNAAHSTNAPVQISGSDGTNVRRILTDVAGNTQVVGGLVAGASALLSTTGVRPVQQGMLDGEGRVRHVVGNPRGQINVRYDDATTTSEAGVIDALNDVVRELKLLNARIADLPYWLGVGAAMPDDASTFRDDPYLFNQ